MRHCRSVGVGRVRLDGAGKPVRVQASRSQRTTMPRATPRHFSMVRDFHLADFLTLCNAACGVAGVFLAMLFAIEGDKRYFYLAALMAPAAFVFDVFDGKVARWRNQHTALGRELDSLAD